jgi:hypothetical protein
MNRACDRCDQGTVEGPSGTRHRCAYCNGSGVLLERRVSVDRRRGTAQIPSTWVLFAHEILRSQDSADQAVELARRVIEAGALLSADQPIMTMQTQFDAYFAAPGVQAEIIGHTGSSPVCLRAMSWRTGSTTIRASVTWR